MSIERCGDTYTPVCDYCGDELPPEYDFYDAVEAKKAAGWKSIKDDCGEWSDACPECARELRPNAANDFRGVGRPR